MDNLKENEWNTINKILLELYDLDNIKEFSVKLLKMFRMLIPYSQGYFIMFDNCQRINLANSSNIGMTDDEWDKYVNNFFDKDYINYIFDFASDTVTYRDTDILEDKIRKNTEFYQEFLRPHSIPYGSGIILIKDGGILGVINLFRSASLGDFSDKDIHVLEILKQHLANIAHRLLTQSMDNEKTSNDKIADLIEEIGLSAREVEVMEFMNKGYSNAEISDELVISLSTVKKHIYNIYTKAGVRSRTQLIALFSQ